MEVMISREGREEASANLKVLAMEEPRQLDRDNVRMLTRSDHKCSNQPANKIPATGMPTTTRSPRINTKHPSNNRAIMDKDTRTILTSQKLCQVRTTWERWVDTRQSKFTTPLVAEAITTYLEVLMTT